LPYFISKLFPDPWVHPPDIKKRDQCPPYPQIGGGLKALGFALFLTIFFAVGEIPNKAIAADQNIRNSTVLIIESFHPEMPWHRLFDRGFSSVISKLDEQPVILKEYMDSIRFPNQINDGSFSSYLMKKYKGSKIDLLITQAGPASMLLLQRPNLFSGIPRLFVNPVPTASRFLDMGGQGSVISADANVHVSFNGMLSSMRPKHVYVVGETRTPLVKRYINELRKEHPESSSEFTLEYLLDLPMKELVSRVKELPPDSVVFYSLIFQDELGKELVPYQVARQISQNSSAPVFSHWDSLIGSGIVGGYMLSANKVGELAGRNMLAMLSGNTAPKRHTKPEEAFVHIYDWQALNRHDISLSQLPEGSKVVNQNPTFWSQYRLYILVAVGMLILLSLSIALWIVTLRRTVSRRTDEIIQNENTLNFISQRGWEEFDGGFFDSLTNYLGTNLNVDYALIDLINPDGHTARTVSLYALGEFPGNMEYPLECTPCENVFGKNLCCYPDNIQQLFPKDTLLVDMEANSYAGIPLWSSNKEPIGLIAVLSCKPFREPERIKSVLQLVAMRASQELEHVIFEENLIRAKADAEAANKAKTEFLAAMSHDLRTPLNAIMGFSDMMRQKAFGPLDNDHYEQYVDDIHRSGALLVSLINDVLDLSKIEAGKYELEEESINISELIDSSILQLSPLADISNLTLTNDVRPDMPHLEGDERALMQILNNLLSNSIKFSSKGGMVNVSALLREDNGITFSIKDTGIGMSEEGIIKALRPFEQADGTHSRRHEGTGLGLYLCVNFMMLFGGSLEIKSEVNNGTTVFLRFPPERTIFAS